MKRFPYAILLDLDGTVVDSKMDLAASVNLVRAEFGLPDVSVDTVVGWIGDGANKLLERACGEANLVKARQSFLHHYGENGHLNSILYPGMISFLRQAVGHRLAIVTNKPQVFTLPLLAGLGIDGFFDVIVGARPGVPHKPDPSSIYEALRHLDVARTDAVMIGDGTQDMEAGRNAGVSTCAVTWGYRPRAALEACKPDWIVTHPGELFSLLR